MRRSLTLSFLALTFLPASAFAAAQDWQAQLQRNLDSVTGPRLAADGKVNVSDENGTWYAQLPALTLKDEEGGAWTIPPVAMTRRNGGDAVTIRLPGTIARTDGQGKITIGQQDVTGTWQDATGRFGSLKGRLQNVSGTRTENDARATAGQVGIASQGASGLVLTLNDIAASSTVEGEAMRATAKSMSYSYEFKGGSGLGIEQIIGLVQQNYLAASKYPVNLTVNARDVAFRNGQKTTSVATAEGRFLLTPKKPGDTVDVKAHLTADGISYQPAGVNGAFLPRQADVTGTIASLPVSLLSFSPGLDGEAAKAQAAKAGTKINLDDIRAETAAGAKLAGNGQLTAKADVPMGFTGRVTLKTENLNQVTNALQKQMNAPGADMATQAQAMFGYFMMQGMGTQNNGAVQYVLDLTPDGQILMNGKDVTGPASLWLKGRAQTQGTLPFYHTPQRGMPQPPGFRPQAEPGVQGEDLPPVEQ